MPTLLNPQTYLPLDAFKATANDLVSLSTYSDPQLTILLTIASAKADAIMRRTLLPTEKTKRLVGNGTAVLNLHEHPVLWVKQIQFALPGASGFAVPTNEMLIDYERGELLEYTPLTFAGVGYATVFPEHIPIDVTLASGYGLPIPPPSNVVATDLPGTGLSPGQYDIAVTTRTMSGESTATIQTITTATGVVRITFAPVLGAYTYRLYAAPHPTMPLGLGLVAESPAALYGIVQSGLNPVSLSFSSLASPPNAFSAAFPVIDSTALPFPGAVVEATRLLALQSLYEQNNLANRGVQSDRRQDGAATAWRGTQGSEGKGEGWFTTEVKRLLAPYSLQDAY